MVIKSLLQSLLVLKQDVRLNLSQTHCGWTNLRSTENARCTIMIRFVYEYATLDLLHATPYLRMLRRIYDRSVSLAIIILFPLDLDLE